MRHITLSFIAQLFFFGLSFSQAVDSQDYLFTILPKIELANATHKEAIEKIVNVALSAGAKQRGFVGVTIEVDPPATGPSITMELRDAPLGVALEYVAGYCLGHIASHRNGIVTIAKSPSITSTLLRLSPKVRKAFGLKENSSKDEIRQALIKSTFQLGRDTEIKLGTDKDLVLVRLGVEDARNLEALVQMIERGLPLDLGENGKEKGDREERKQEKK